LVFFTRSPHSVGAGSGLAATDAAAPDSPVLNALQKVQLGHGAISAARDLLQQEEPSSALLVPQIVRQVQDMAMEEFQRCQQQKGAKKTARLPPRWRPSAAIGGRAEPGATPSTFDSFSMLQLLSQTRFNPKFVSRKIGGGSTLAAVLAALF